MQVAFHSDTLAPPVTYRQPEANAAFLGFMKGLKAARESALKQRDMPPEKVVPLTTEQLVPLVACRKQFQDEDGIDQRPRLMFLSVFPEFSKAPLENLDESTPLFTASG